MKKRPLPWAALSAILLLSTPVHAEDYVLIIKDHKFSPSSLVLPAGVKIKLTVKNQQAEAAEFESSDLDREKAMQPEGEITVLLGPLDPGTYSFFDDFHRETTGTITVK